MCRRDQDKPLPLGADAPRGASWRRRARRTARTESPVHVPLRSPAAVRPDRFGHRDPALVYRAHREVSGTLKCACARLRRKIARIGGTYGTSDSSEAEKSESDWHVRPVLADRFPFARITVAGTPLPALLLIGGFLHVRGPYFPASPVHRGLSEGSLRIGTPSTEGEASARSSRRPARPSVIADADASISIDWRTLKALGTANRAGLLTFGQTPSTNPLAPQQAGMNTALRSAPLAPET
jgi:hypothetical protein